MNTAPFASNSGCCYVPLADLRSACLQSRSYGARRGFALPRCDPYLAHAVWESFIQSRLEGLHISLLAQMPYLPETDPDPHYLFIIGQCTHVPKAANRFIAASIRGTFTLEEANSFLVKMFDDEEVPPYQDHFSYPHMIVHTVGITFDVLPRPGTSMRHCLDHYSTVDYLSAYEWNVVRREVHQYLYPQKRDVIFGDFLPERLPDEIQEVR